MRLLSALLVVGVIALFPGALALEADGFATSEPAPSEVEVGAPGQTFEVDGTAVVVDSEQTGTDAPADAAGSVDVRDVIVEAQAPTCKFSTDISTGDENLQSCEQGHIRTNAGLDLVDVDVDLRVLEERSATGSEDVSAESGAVTMLEPTAARTVLLAAAAAGASAGLLYGLWRLLKWTGLAAVLPLYSHISDDEILDDPNRAGIYGLIQKEAGISTKDIADRLGLAWGTVTHHLNKLEKRRFVVSKKYGKYRRYFANGAGGTERKDEVAVLRVDRTGDVAALIQSRPGLTQKQVSDLMGVSSSTILWHVKRLEQVNLVTKVREGKTVRYFPTGALSGQLIAPPASVA